MSEPSGSNSNNNSRNKRKRKKNVLMNARKYAKKGNFGRGTYIEEDMCKYFVSILEVIRDGVEGKEAKESLANGVLDQVKGRELDFSTNQIACRVIEQVLPMSTPEYLENFSNALAAELRPVCSDQFASHVVEKLVEVTAQRALEGLQPTKPENNTYSDEHMKYCGSFALRISKYLLNNLEEFVQDPYANHIIRTCVTSMSGLEKPDKDKKSFQSLNQIFKVVPDEWSKVASEFSERLSSWPHFVELPNTDITSGLLQATLSSLTKCNNELQQDIITQLVKTSFAPTFKKENTEESIDPNQLVPVFNSPPAIRLLETAILLANEKRHDLIYTKCFKNKLRALSLTKISNFSVQKLVDTCKSKEQFELIINELTSSFSDILGCGHTGVLVALAKASRRLISQQGLFVKAITSALHCEDSNHSFKLAALTARLLPLERAEQAEKFFVNIHGSAILQEMLHFNKPIKLVNSLLAMAPNDILTLICDAKGSHIIDAFYESSFIGEKSREKMNRILKGHFQAIATDKYGSRVFETIWKKVDKAQQTRIMNELASKSGLLQNTTYGTYIAIKLNVELYKRSSEEWEKHLQKKDKIKTMFEDIV